MTYLIAQALDDRGVWILNATDDLPSAVLIAEAEIGSSPYDEVNRVVPWQPIEGRLLPPGVRRGWHCGDPYGGTQILDPEAEPIQSDWESVLAGTDLRPLDAAVQS